MRFNVFSLKAVGDIEVVIVALGLSYNERGLINFFRELEFILLPLAET